MKEENKGITLIALVITIIVLLILAGITIRLLTGNEGILKKTEESVIETNHATIKEQIVMKSHEYYIQKHTSKQEKNSMKSTIVDFLLAKNVIEIPEDNNDTYYRVKANELYESSKLGYGQNKEHGDIYTIDKDDEKTYVLRYYGFLNNEEPRTLLYLSVDGKVTDPSEGELTESDKNIFSYNEDGTMITGINHEYLNTLENANEQIKNIVFPKEKVQGTAIVGIADGAFQNETRIESIVFQEGVTQIGNQVFSGCSSLSSIKFPDTLETIGNVAFSGTGLQSVDIPDSVISLGGGTFSGCSSLETVSLNATASVQNRFNIAFRWLYGIKECYL